MGVPENRLAHFKSIIDSEIAMAGGSDRQKRVAAFKAVAGATGLKYDYIYQLYTGKSKKQTVGDAFAKALDRAYADGKPEGWIDLPPGAESNSPAPTAQGEATLLQAVAKLAAVLKPMDEESRNMVSTALSNLCRNPAGIGKAVANIETQIVLSGGNDPSGPPAPAPANAGGESAERVAPVRARLSVRRGGGQKMQLDLPLRKTVPNPFDPKAEPPGNELQWYRDIKKVAK